MKHSRSIGFLAIGMVATACLANAGCSSGTGNSGGSGGNGASGGNGGNGGNAGSGGEAGAGGEAGSGGGAIVPACVDGTVLAIDHIYFGDTDPDGTANPTNGWKQYGRNIDNLISAKDSTDLCQPSTGGSPNAVYPDGNDGIDNSFSKNLLPILLGLASNLTTETNSSLQNGDFTYLLTIRGQNEPMSCPASALFGGRALGSTPKFDGTDQWPLDPAYFSDPSDPASVKTVFPGVTIVNDLYKSGPEAAFAIEMHLGGEVAYLPIQHAQFEMTLQNGQTEAIAGQISGIIDPEELTKEMARVAGIFDASFCDPNSPTLKSILNQMRQASDIMLDGTQDPTKVCNGISIGVGFTMKSAQIGVIGPAVTLPMSPCTP